MSVGIKIRRTERRLGVGNSGVETLSDDLDSPVGCFPKDGSLVVVSGDKGRIYEVDSRGTNQSIDFPWTHGRVIAVTRGEGSNEFAFFTEAGLVHLLRVVR